MLSFEHFLKESLVANVFRIYYDKFCCGFDLEEFESGKFVWKCTGAGPSYRHLQNSLSTGF